MCHDSTLIRTDRLAARNPSTDHHLGYYGRHKASGGNVQVITDHSGFPVRVSPIEPGSTQRRYAST